ncbi:60S ribosomal protein L18a-like protein [Canna indica]|uniref:60S ribosomal protein L18a-like protein n=1 Tax=Canna indica TaxID=4628 RepID=A0AAQ3K6Z0_9LILI|nr:60S ribosomal protein L18a-like protein [Canna indica]
MSEEEGRSKGYYGTFQGGPDYAQPAIGFPQPVPPPGLTAGHAPPQPPPHHSGPPYYAQGYQGVPGYAPVVEGRPLRLPRLPCCGLGIGWLLFIIGFFLAAIPWYVGAFILMCVRVDYREKPGLVACTIAVSDITYKDVMDFLPVLFFLKFSFFRNLPWFHYVNCFSFLLC